MQRLVSPFESWRSGEVKRRWWQSGRSAESVPGVSGRSVASVAQVGIIAEVSVGFWKRQLASGGRDFYSGEGSSLGAAGQQNQFPRGRGICKGDANEYLYSSR